MCASNDRVRCCFLAWQCLSSVSVIRQRLALSLLIRHETKADSGIRLRFECRSKVRMIRLVEKGSLVNWKITAENGALRMRSAASFWFEIWGSCIRVKNRFFQGNFQKISIFFRDISEKCRYFSGKLPKHFAFSTQISKQFRYFSG